MRVFTRAFGTRPVGLLAGRRRDQRRARWSCSPPAASAGRRAAPRCCASSLELVDADAAQDPLAYNRPYRLGGTGMSCFFRDDALSDLIGFTYATWHGDDAAANLVNELHAARARVRSAAATTRCSSRSTARMPGSITRSTATTSCARSTRSSPITRGSSSPRSRMPERAASSPRRCRGCRRAAGCTARSRPGSGIPAKNRAWDLLCDAKEAYDRVMQRRRARSGAARRRRPAARPVRELGLVLVVRRLQPRRCREPVRPALPAAAACALPAAEPRAAGGARAADRGRRRNARARRGHAPRQRLTRRAAAGRLRGHCALARFRPAPLGRAAADVGARWPRSVAAGARSSTGSPLRASPCGRSCPRGRSARMARPTGCARISPATPPSSIPRSCPTAARRSARSSSPPPAPGCTTTRCSRR